MTTWNIGSVCISDDKCPEIAKTTMRVVLNKKAEAKISHLLKVSPSLEWMAMLLGKQVETTYVIEDIEVFEQENTSGHTELTPEGDKQLAAFRKKNEIFGWIHSHCDMSAFQSNDDIDTANMHTVSITINNKRETYCTVKTKLPCGKEALIVTPVVFEYDVPETGFITRVKELVKEKVCGVTYNSYVPVFKPKHVKFTKGEIIICNLCGNVVSKHKVFYCKLCQKPHHRRCLDYDEICDNCLQFPPQNNKWIPLGEMDSAKGILTHAEVDAAVESAEDAEESEQVYLNQQRQRNYFGQLEVV